MKNNVKLKNIIDCNIPKLKIKDEFLAKSKD